tara:strand:+ start:3649 stop:4779 length:1131 start_codon:yes stop_codon:yes gene_type:complete
LSKKNNKKFALMSEVLHLAAKGLGLTSPNPLVGAIVTDSRGVIVGRGWHERFGAPHAEVIALQEAGIKAKGGTLYVNLEPCSHHGKTPPCAPLIVESGIDNVVIAVKDPNPLVNGKGLEILESNSIRVEYGIMEKEAILLNEPFFTHTVLQRPLVTIKVASSLDGFISRENAKDRWITGEKSRDLSHHFRNSVDAILVGVQTILEDDPQLTARPKGIEGNPLVRVVLDTNLRTPLNSKILNTEKNNSTIIMTGEDISSEDLKRFQDLGVKIVGIPKNNRGLLDISKVLDYLAKLDVTHLLVEGGGLVHGSFVREKLADHLMCFVAPIIIGSNNGVSSFRGINPEGLTDSTELIDLRHEFVGKDILYRGRFKKPFWE